MTDPTANLPSPPTQDDGKLLSETQAQKLAKREHKWLAEMRVDRNRWFYITVASLIVTAVMGMGWMKAEQRFAENVRVAYVKLDPSGAYTIEYADENRATEYFPANVESKLSEWVRRRYSKHRETIKYDYGFAQILMSPAMRRQFLESGENNYHAAKIAAETAECANCPSVTTEARLLQTLDKDLLPKKLGLDYEYTTQVFATETMTTPDGQVMGAKNKIYTLHWRFRPKSYVVGHKQELQDNPMGMEIFDVIERDDPTPAKPARQ